MVGRKKGSFEEYKKSQLTIIKRLFTRQDVAMEDLKEVSKDHLWGDSINVFKGCYKYDLLLDHYGRQFVLLERRPYD